MTRPVMPIRTAEVEFAGSTPMSARHRDSYFMPGQGLAESWKVFIEANALPARFARLLAGEVFSIGETGFGTGLNMLLAARCFLDKARPNTRLHLQSAELHPLKKSDLTRALNDWPELKPLGQRLLDDYPPPVPGWHRVDLAANVSLTLMFGDATEQWQQATNTVNAWFLDGFAPSLNPDIWQAALLKTLAARSAPGATLSSFTAAGHVRRGLIEAGFEVWREPGFGRKRHRLCGRMPGDPIACYSRCGRAIVVGAGLAGSTSARALADRGWEVTIIDQEAPASGASGNHCGVVYSTPSAHLTAQNRFYQTSLLTAMRWFRALAFPAEPDQGRLAGILLKPHDARSTAKLAAALETGAWPPELLSKDHGLYQVHAGGYVRPEAWCLHLLDHELIRPLMGQVTAFCPGARPTVTTADGQVLSADALILATATNTRDLPGLGWLPTGISRGQLSHVAATEASSQWTQPLCHAGYLIPAVSGLHCVGASYDRQRSEPVVDPADDAFNLDQLASHLPRHHAALGGDQARVVSSRAALRCESPDRLPLAGVAPDPSFLPHRELDNVYLNIAHGSRGLTHTPLCAELLADTISLRPVSVEPEIRQALAPERFVVRKRRREPGWKT
ncbi:MAG: bifunctional tRNA (5-methylaminomethyl-2-thiouridine)(34)-methyltransferase MnmD/FAD-dependent 5-carboxymethylaminomethyl-2-thiouridine(34) oxidoreductase MnmC [Wenzhouxiangella sp.]|nr:bifunctional tRNA (5-methylaminomethyl-2-thiouridine)(34)-methyltransferase MnmD/FAD-dependent 5-carboxymethylaminomethyl-2-thiouridine(34) oxidoreductase MnmC [Wenzhouxiangella sp.]